VETASRVKSFEISNLDALGEPESKEWFIKMPVPITEREGKLCF